MSDDGCALTLARMNAMWQHLKDDQIGVLIHKCNAKVGRFEVERRVTLKNEAKRSQMKMESNARSIAKLRLRAKMEKDEADAAATRLVKEKGQFEKALEAFHDEQQKLRQEIASAEVDGVIDQVEEAAIARLNVDVKVAEARLEKEKGEFLDWVKRAETEMSEATMFQLRCERELVAYTEIIEQSKRFEGGHAFEPTKEAPGLSICMRLLSFGCDEDQDDPISIQTSAEKERGVDSKSAEVEGEFMTCRRLLFRDGTSYEGGWDTAKLQPSGHGSEQLTEYSCQYLGEVDSDLWHGVGSLFFHGLSMCYAGRWNKGMREGPGLHCSITPNGTVVPIVYCLCAANKVTHYERYVGKSNRHHIKLMELTTQSVRKALLEVTRARQLCPCALVDDQNETQMLEEDETYRSSLEKVKTSKWQAVRMSSIFGNGDEMAKISHLTAMLLRGARNQGGDASPEQRRDSSASGVAAMLSLHTPKTSSSKSYSSKSLSGVQDYSPLALSPDKTRGQSPGSLFPQPAKAPPPIQASNETSTTDFEGMS